MKRLGKVYDKIISKDNLRIALHNACKGKSSYASVRYIKKHVDEHIDALHEMLKLNNLMDTINERLSEES